MVLDEIIIATSGRIHINSLKMNDVGGRGCGGVGIALAYPALQMRFSPARDIAITGQISPALHEKIASFADRMLKHTHAPGVRISVDASFSHHVGLGSGTQVGLCTGYGISELYRIGLSLKETASITGRAGVSGVGFYGFSHGGIIIDGGYTMGEGQAKRDFADHASHPPPLLAQYDFPSDWKILLIVPDKAPAMTQFDENAFFQKNTPIPLCEVEAICTDTLMGIMPSVIEKDYASFIRCLSYVASMGTKRIELELNHQTMQQVNDALGDLLAQQWVKMEDCHYVLAAQGDSANRCFNDDPAMRYHRELAVPSDRIPFLGISSLGPSMYTVLLDGYHRADTILEETRRRLPAGWQAYLSQARNEPASIVRTDSRGSVKGMVGVR